MTAASSVIGRVIDNTALDAFMRCPRLYYFSMILNRRHAEGSKSAALQYGSSWHHAMEAHYKGASREAVHAFVMSKWHEPTAAEDYRTLSRVLMEYDNYLKTYGTPDEEAARGLGKTLGTPGAMLVELPVELSIPGVRHPYAGKIDRIFERNGLFYVEDHKTTSRFDKGYFNSWTLSQQFKGYAVIAQILTGKPIAGVRCNLHVCHKSDSAFERDTIPFSQDILTETIENLDKWMWRLENAAITASDGHIEAAYPANFNACAGRFGMCSYAGVCSSGRRIRQQVLEQDFDIAPWEPLTVDEESAL